MPEGSFAVLVRAVDGAGKSSTVSIPINKDSIAPAISMVSPGAADIVNGTVTLSGRVSDDGTIASVEYSADGKEWFPLDARSRGYVAIAAEGAQPDTLQNFSFVKDVDFTTLEKSLATISFRAKDAAGNVTVFAPLAEGVAAFTVDPIIDKPRIEVQLPVENEVIRTDFVISGMAFDDDGISEIFYRIDGGEWTNVPAGSSFSIPLKLAEMTDNGHEFEAYAVDINGIKGEVAKRTYRVSKEEPVASLTSPAIDLTVRGVIELTGTASDANGIQELWISFDNGNSYVKAEGAEAWKYRLDTKILKDGSHSIYVKVYDKYETQGFFSTILNVDNVAPTIVIDKPFDGSSITESFSLEGRADDTVVVYSLTLDIAPIDTPKGAVMTIPLPTDGVFRQPVDVSKLAPGWYNLKITARDKANNASYISRDVQVREKQRVDSIQFLFPLDGENQSTFSSLEGRLITKEKIDTIVIYLDGKPFSTVKTQSNGYFSLRTFVKRAESELAIEGLYPIEEGLHTIQYATTLEDGTEIRSESRKVSFTFEGPWLTADALPSGSFLVKRPWLEGYAGWTLVEPPLTEKALHDNFLRIREEKRVRLVEYSLDNGKSFRVAEGTDRFRFRFETQEYPNGDLRLVVRTTYADGSVAVLRRLYTVDTKLPDVTILEPGENGRFNSSVMISGTARDESGLKSVEVIVRKGDKASYEVPGFIQGSYFDVHLLGSTRWEGAFGLSFFDNNVKLQVGLGQGYDVQPSWSNLLGFWLPESTSAEESRFRGFVGSLRLLANIAYIPFGYYFGPDWDWLSMSFAVGADFKYFSMQTDIAQFFNPPISPFTGQPQMFIISSILVQWEFFSLSFANATFFKSIATYAEGAVSFIPSEAAPDIRLNFAVGVRIGLF